MKLGKILSVLGIIITAIAVVIMVVGFTSIPSPAEEAVWTGNYNYADEKTASLEPGEYEVWYPHDDNPGQVTITDQRGYEIFDEYNIIFFSSPKSVSVNGRDYDYLGDFVVEEEGTVYVETSDDGTVYITKPIDPAASGLLIGGSVFLLILGIVFIIAGVAVWFSAKAKEKKAASQGQAPAAQPYQGGGYGQYQGGGEGQATHYPCPYCGTPLTYYPQYARHYCSGCARYV